MQYSAIPTSLLVDLLDKVKERVPYKEVRLLLEAIDGNVRPVNIAPEKKPEVKEPKKK